MGVPCSKDAELRKQVREIQQQLSRAQEHISVLEAEQQLYEAGAAEPAGDFSQRPRLLNNMQGFGWKLFSPAKDQAGMVQNSSQGSNTTAASNASAMSTASSFVSDLASVMSRRSTREAIATGHCKYPSAVRERPRRPDPVVSLSTIGHY